MIAETKIPGFIIKAACEDDIVLLLEFIKELADFEKLSHKVVATKEILKEGLFVKKAAKAVIGYCKDQPVCFAIYFYNLSTFLGRPGLYLEDLFVKSNYRGRGFGKTMLAFLAKRAIEEGCGRFEWSVLDWNSPAIDFYQSIGAQPMEEWITYRLAGSSLETLANQF